MTYDQFIAELKDLGFENIIERSASDPYVFTQGLGGVYFYHTDNWHFHFSIEDELFCWLCEGGNGFLSWNKIETMDIASMIALYK